MLFVKIYLQKPTVYGFKGFKMKSDRTKKTIDDRRRVEVPHPSYQPNARELKEDLRLEGTFADAIKALVKSVKIRRVVPKRS